jgi:hypothetical protein
MYSLKEGEFLVKTARKAVEEYFKHKKILQPQNFPKKFLEPKGVFVTLKTKDHKLRGCIGYPLPTKPLILALIKSAINAAFFDSRFKPLRKSELDKIIFEVSILSDPKLLKVEEPTQYLQKIEIGRHGLIIEKGLNAGLLLPQVATEFNFDQKRFLESVCLKAGLDKNAWKTSNTRIYIFEAEIFSEKRPGGEIVRVEL